MDGYKLWRGTAVFLFSVIGLMVLLVALGLFDPKPLGELRWQKSLPALTVGAQARELVWLDGAADGVYSVRGTAVYQSGERDSIYGLVLGNDEDYLAAAVSPSGYVTLWHGETVLLPLQPWPHVHLGQEANEIWLDVRGDEVTVRLNRELLWVGKVALSHGVGVIGESWGETAVIHFPSIELFAP